MSISKETHQEEALELFKKLRSSEKVAKELAEKYELEYSASLGRKVRKWIMDTRPEKAEESDQFKEAKQRKVVKGKKIYLISAAQNETPVNKQLLLNMEAYAKHLGAQIEVIPLRYQNPTSVFTDRKHDNWDKSLDDYLIANRHPLNNKVTVLADVKTQLTASDPLSGMEGLTGIESSIIGHPRHQFKVMPTLEGYPMKIMATTGCVTVPNYTDSKAGKKGEFHHTLGFIVVELGETGKEFNMRQVSAHKNGTFYDLDIIVENGAISKDKTAVEAIVLGDLHLGSQDDLAMKCAYSMLERFKPKNVILHDINDGHSINHHEANDPFKQMEKEEDGSYSIRREMDQMLKFLDSIIKYNPVVVRSNHDDFFDRWLIASDWRKGLNKKDYLKYANLKAEGKLPNGIVPYEISCKFGKKVVCLNENSSFRVRGVELASHGHIGKGGSRGTPSQYLRLNTKMVTAHTHSPFRKDGLMGVGTLTLSRLGYNKGVSDWGHSNVIVHKNGKMQNLLIINGEYSIL